MCQFYSLTPFEVDELDIETAHYLWESITIIEARESLRQLQISDYPHLKKDRRQKLHRELSKQAYPATFKEKKKISLEDMAKLLGGAKK